MASEEENLRLAAAIDLYRRGLVSQGKAAEMAGIPRADFIDELAARKVDVFQVDFDELKREIEEEAEVRPGRAGIE